MALMMSSQLLSMRFPLGCNDGLSFSRIQGRGSLKQQPTPLRRIRCTPCRRKRLQCVAAVAGNHAVFAPRSAEELQEVFGCQGLSFLDVGGGTTVADLKLENGCKVRLVLRTARITSYKAHMWHRGEEELLHTVRSAKETPTSDSLRGGIELGFFHSLDPRSGIFVPSTASWRVDNVQCEPSNYAQITLVTSSNAEVGIKGSSQGCLQFRYVVTLTAESLSSAMVVTNAGLPSVEVKGSILSHLAVSTIEGTFTVGLNGCNYRSTPTQRFEKLSQENDFFPPIWGAETNSGLDSPANSTAGTDFDRKVNEGGRCLVESEDYGPIRGGATKLYSRPPSSFTVLDRGFRRSVVVQRVGFEDVWMLNPGPSSKLPDWDNFICVGPTQTTQSVVLLEKEKWRAAQILINPGYD